MYNLWLRQQNLSFVVPRENNQETEMPSPVFGICEFHQSYF